MGFERELSSVLCGQGKIHITRKIQKLRTCPQTASSTGTTGNASTAPLPTPADPTHTSPHPAPTHTTECTGSRGKGCGRGSMWSYRVGKLRGRTIRRGRRIRCSPCVGKSGGEQVSFSEPLSREAMNMQPSGQAWRGRKMDPLEGMVFVFWSVFWLVLWSGGGRQASRNQISFLEAGSLFVCLWEMKNVVALRLAAVPCAIFVDLWLGDSDEFQCE
eukprot:764418-Hanusia_phi.AAC.2